MIIFIQKEENQIFQYETIAFLHKFTNTFQLELINSK
jgi:hypothetical protein